MGVSKMPASNAERRIARDPGRGTLAADLFRGCNGNTCGIVCQGHVLASLDTTSASASNGDRQEQASGETVKRTYAIKKIGFRYRQAEIAGIAAIERLEQIAGITSVVRWLRKAHVADHLGVEKPTQELRSFFARWSIKFSAEYYEAKERQAAVSHR